MRRSITNLIYIIKENIKSLSDITSDKIKIGFLVQDPKSYTTAMASTRIRAYDVINYLNKTDNFYAELYKPWRKYDLCIFQKYFNDSAYKKLIRIKKQGTRTLLDVNVNYFEHSNTDQVTEEQIKQIMRFGKKVDGFITVSAFLNRVVLKYFPNKKTIFIPENIDHKLFSVRKKHVSKSLLRLLYVGHAIKAKEILLIEECLEKLGSEYNLEILFICEKKPEIKFKNLKSRYIKFNLNKLPKQLLYGDIKIAPRNLKDSYNLVHAFTKIGYPMAVGIPVVASPLDSYLNSPAIICETNKEWESNLRTLITDPDLRNKLAKEGIKYCKENFSLDLIGKQYEQYFKKLMKLAH
jgi:glycosyltransferase involved in cell wall biosynthesis